MIVIALDMVPLRFCYIVLAASFLGCSKNEGKTTGSHAHSLNILQLLWREATDRFDPEATYIKAQRYEYGDGVPQSNYEALKWYEKSYRLGNSKAGIALALMYKTDSHLRNEAAADKILKKLSEQGNRDAQKLYESDLNKTKSSTNK